MTDTAKRCGTCKWIVVEATKLTKDLRVNKRFDHSAFPCNVPFSLPQFPACFDVHITEKRWTCPNYGAECAFHERRT